MRFWVRYNGRIEFEYRGIGDTEICERCLDEEITGKCQKARYAVRNHKNQSEYIYCHEKQTPGKQAKHISKITTEAFPEIRKAAADASKEQNEIKIIAYHNAKKMNASIGHKISKIIPGDSFTKADNKIEIIASEIKKSPDLAAREILSILKTVEQIEAEYNLIEVLDSDEPFDDSDLTTIKVHKLLVLGFYLYEEEFRRKRVYVDINHTDISIKVDYGVAKSAIGQIFNNAVKYCKPDSKVNINAIDIGNYIEINFSMTSLYFNDEETKTLMNLGTRGHQTEDINGEGIGLYAVFSYMKKHKGYFKMDSNPSTRFKSGNKTYSENLFTLGFYKY